MSMHSDYQSTRLAATGDIYGGPARIKGVYIVASATAGSIVIRDGGASGEVLCTLDTPGAAGMAYVDLGDGGLRCRSTAHATLANLTAATFFYA